MIISSVQRAAPLHSTADSQSTNESNTPYESEQVRQLNSQLVALAQRDPDAFKEALSQAFGGKADSATLDAMLVQARQGNLTLPAVQFVDAGTLGPNAMGAYSAENGSTIFLDRRLLSDAVQLQAVFTEEVGHHLDALLGGADAAGDEGAIFAQTLLGESLSANELTELRSENDAGLVLLDGRSLRVEFSMDEAAAGLDDTEVTSNSDNTGSVSEPDFGGSDNDNDDPPPSNGSTAVPDPPAAPPSEADTESALAGLGHAGTGIGMVEGLNQKAGQGQLPDDIKGLNRGVGAGLRGLGTLGTLADPALAFEHDRRRAESDGADTGEQMVEGMRGALKRADNVAATLGGAALGGLSGNPLVATGAGAAAGGLYGGSPIDEGFDDAVDTVVDGAQSNPTSVPPPDVSPAGTLNQGFSSFNRTR